MIIENVGTTPLDYNAFFARLKTADSREYQAKFVTTSIKPLLQYGTQQPADSTRGWIIFEIPDSAQAATLVYSVSGGATQVSIDLR